jgi:hypothetical protein
MRERTEITWSRRIVKVIYVVVINIVLWIVVPNLLISFLARSVPNLESTGEIIYVYGAIITALQALGALTEGSALSVPFNSGSYIASAYYIYIITNGGLLAFSSRGIALELNFQLLLALMVLASLFNALRYPIVYLLDQSEASKGATDEV